MTTYSATIRLVCDEGVDAPHCVVDQADPVIWISDELIEDATDPTRTRYSGDMEVDGDLVHFGTEGKGLGRLTYRFVEHDFPRQVSVWRRVE